MKKAAPGRLSMYEMIFSGDPGSNALHQLMSLGVPMFVLRTLELGIGGLWAGYCSTSTFFFLGGR